METELDEYLLRPRDSKREKELLRRLREVPEEARYAIVQQLLQRNDMMGLLMANGSLQQPRYFEEILQIGFKVGDASTIRSWLECAVPKLGFRKVIFMLGSLLETDPVAVDKALYWMGQFKPQNNPRADHDWNRIKARRREIAALQQSRPIVKTL